MKLSKILLEQELPTEIPGIGNIANQLAKAIDNELEKEEDKLQATNEVAGIVGILGIVLLSNTIGNMVSKIAKYLAKKFNSPKMMKSAEWWYEFTHRNEEAFMSPIKRVLSLFVKDEEKIKPIAKIIYAIIIFTMAGQAGGEAVSFLKKSKWWAASGVGIKSLIKGVEVNTLIKSAYEDLIN